MWQNDHIATSCTSVKYTQPSYQFNIRSKGHKILRKKLGIDIMLNIFMHVFTVDKVAKDQALMVLEELWTGLEGLKKNGQGV